MPPPPSPHKAHISEAAHTYVHERKIQIELRYWRGFYKFGRGFGHEKEHK
jgi:hypothetical protein